MTFVLALLLCLHLAFAAAVAGASAVAVTCDLFAWREGDRVPARLAGDLLQRTLLTRGTGLLGVVSLGMVFLILPRAYPVSPLPAAGWGGALLGLAAGLTCLYAYRTRRGDGPGPGLLLLGAAGVGLLTAVYFALVSGAVLLTAPERWPVLEATPTLVLSWSGAARFLFFATLGLALAGAGLVLGARRKAGEEVRLYVRTGSALVLLAVLSLPLWLLLDLVNLPFLANAPQDFALAAVAVAVAAAAALLSLRSLAAGGKSGGWGLMTLVLCLVLLFVARGHVQRQNALAPQVFPLMTVEAAPAASGTAPRGTGTKAPAEAGKAETGKTASPAGEPPPGAAAEAAAGRGRDIFERLCSGCHAFDRRVVGPPLDEVVPAYRGRREALERFLADPVKKNPAYPAMPDLDLAAEEVAAVAGYLLQTAGTKGGR